MKKGERTRLRIFETASELFLSEDIDGVTVDAIVEKAGVSKGTFYLYFESKDALVAAFLAENVRDVDMGYEAHLDSLPAEMPAGDMLLSLIGKICDVLIENIGWMNMRNLYKVHLTGKSYTESVMGYNRKLYRIFSDALERGVKKGEFKLPLPLDAMSKHFVMAIRGLCFEWCSRYPDFDLKANALQHFRLLVGAITVNPLSEQAHTE